MNKDLLMKVAQAFGWLMLTAVIASVGFLSDNPGVMVPAFALFFMAAVGGMYFYLTKKKRNTYVICDDPRYIHPHACFYV